VAVARAVTFRKAPDAAHDAIDSAYHAKYDRYGQGIVGHVAGPQSHDVTLRLVPDAAATTAITE
jgi:Uncharacterized protein conserved in bacteria (DUF2255)